MVKYPKIAIREFSQSFARPWLMKLNDDRDYIVKFAHEKKDNSLNNEVMCGFLAKKLDLPMVEMEFVELDNEFINKTTDLVTRLVKPGKHFATALVAGSTNVGTEVAKGIPLDKIANADKIPGMITFDVFVCNTDRSPANSLIAPIDEGRQKYRYWMIDHGLCFGSNQWNANSIENLPFLPSNIPWNVEGITGIESFRPFIEQLKGLEKKDYQEMIEAIPKEWQPNEADLSKLVEILVKRDEEQIVNVLEQIKRNDNNRFPNWR